MNDSVADLFRETVDLNTLCLSHPPSRLLFFFFRPVGRRSAAGGRGWGTPVSWCWLSSCLRYRSSRNPGRVSWKRRGSPLFALWLTTPRKRLGLVGSGLAAQFLALQINIRPRRRTFFFHCFCRLCSGGVKKKICLLSRSFCLGFLFIGFVDAHLF